MGCSKSTPFFYSIVLSMRIFVLLATVSAILLSCSTTAKVGNDKYDQELTLSDGVPVPGLEKAAIRDWKIITDAEVPVFFFSTSLGIYYSDLSKSYRKSSEVPVSFDLSNFSLNAADSDTILIGIYRGDNILRAYTDLDKTSLRVVSAGDIPSTVDNITGIKLYKEGDLLYGYVIGQRGQMEKWNFTDPGWGQLDGKVISRYNAPYPAQYLTIMDGFLYGNSLDKGWWSMDMSTGTFRQYSYSKYKFTTPATGFTVTKVKKERYAILSNQNMLYLHDTAEGKLIRKIRINIQPDDKIRMITAAGDVLFILLQQNEVNYIHKVYLKDLFR